MNTERIRVMIADAGYEMLGRQLEAYNGERFDIVCCTADGNEVYDQVLQAQPDVLLMDVFITNVDGLEVLEQLRENPSLTELKIIFLSTVGSSRIINMAFNLGADYYMMKPCNPKVLAKRIIQILQRLGSRWKDAKMRIPNCQPTMCMTMVCIRWRTT